MIITILTDNANSWFVRYGEILSESLIRKGHTVEYVFDKNNIKKGDICFLLSCTKLVEKQYLQLNNNNIVVHASDLPKGKGFSPLQWQVLEGADDITLTLFEVVEEVDAGPYYLKENVTFNGTELLEELRNKMANKIIEICLKYVESHNNLEPIEQIGEETFYPRRRKYDDEINPEKSIIEQFNHFRVADNEKYPLFFYYKDVKYSIKIEKTK